MVVEPRHASELMPVARRFVAQAAAVTGVRLHIASSATVRPGDVVLSLSPCDAATASSIGAEGYSLFADKAVSLRANTANGIFYATQTMLQMLSIDGNREGAHASLPKGFVLDYPRLKERSLMIDVGRKFASVDFLTDYMKFMGAYKLNTLHLHLSDDVLDANRNVIFHGFRLKSQNPGFNGPISSDGMYYTRRDWRRLEAAAAENGISIVPEFDTPGHAASFVAARPDLVYQGDPVPGAALDPTLPGTLEYVKSVFDEFLPWFRSSVVHIGGDEVNLNGGTVPPAAEVAYVNALGSYLESKGKTVQLWGEEPLSSYGIKQSFVIQRWRAFDPTTAFGRFANASLRVDPNFNWSSIGNNWIESTGSWYVVPFSALGFPSLTGDYVYGSWDDVSTATPDAVGGQVAQWNDCSVSGARACRPYQPYSFEVEVNNALKDVIPAAGQIFWRGQEKDATGALVPYSTLRIAVAAYQYGPDATPLRNSPITGP